MNRFRVFIHCLTLASFIIFLTGCPAGGNNPSGPANTPVPTNTPTVTQTPCICTPTPTATAPATVIVNVSGSSYPAAVTVAQGGIVIWNNTSGINHTVHAFDGAGACTSTTTYANGASVTLTFPSLGTFGYHCQIHSACGASCASSCSSGMFGSVVVQ